MTSDAEETLVIIKNESVRRGLAGRVIQKFEDVGLEITRIKMVRPSKSLVKRHYRVDREWKVRVGTKALNSFKSVKKAETVLGEKDPKIIGAKIYDWSVKQLTRVPIIVMTLSGTSAIEKVKNIAGANEPAKADLGTIRGIYSTDSYLESNLQKRALYNVVHRSSNSVEAKREIKLWFSK